MHVSHNKLCISLKWCDYAGMVTAIASNAPSIDRQISICSCYLPTSNGRCVSVPQNVTTSVKSACSFIKANALKNETVRISLAGWLLTRLAT